MKVFNGQAKILVQGEVVYDFPVMCKAHDREEAEKQLEKDIRNQLRIRDDYEIKFDLTSSTGFGLSR
ncbi:hypothetical protein NYE37_13640 [Thermoactinomyces sp. FSL K6-2592]|jgi:hypothetical protein|uniref:hypothetical protein n=1 Tax=Thermoactinomyces sp. FSL K6-2592 TaxID=2975347 RepID=UPI0030FAF096